MANRAIWGAGLGVGFTWTTAGFTAANFNSLAVGSAVVAATAIANATPLDVYADLSFSLTGTTGTGSQFFAVYLQPLNQDGTTYGDNSATGTVPPQISYQVGSVVVPQSLTSTALVGMLRGIVLPPGSFKFALANFTSNSLASSAAAVVSYRTYVENLNG